MAKMLSKVGTAVAWVARLLLMRFILTSAYEIRLFAIKSYGLVIHEFDPWFNFRATQYVCPYASHTFFLTQNFIH